MPSNTFQNIHTHYRDFLREIYPISEIDSIVKLVIEEITGISFNQQILQSQYIASDKQQEQFQNILERLLKNEPIQYVLGKAHFYELEFEVNRHVLIPRQETELIVHEIIRHINNREIKSVLDIGTGSGCIAIALKKNMPDKKVWALDISTKALEVAKRNAETNHVEIEFIEADILNPVQSTYQLFDLIVSNPPYVRNMEKAQMHRNVKDFEPSGALFVPDLSPLIFYNAIAKFASKNISAKGIIAVEINEALTSETSEVFDIAGFTNSRVIKDFNNKDRFLILSRQ